MKQIFSIYFQRKYSTQCVIQLFLLISACELCPMSHVKSHALYARKDSKTYRYVIPVLKGTSTFLTGTSASHHLSILTVVFLTFTYFIPTILFLVCTLKPHVPSDPREAFIMILQKLPELAHLFAVGVRKQSEYTLIF